MLSFNYFCSFFNCVNRFIYIDVGCQGRISEQHNLTQSTENNDAGLPKDAPYSAQKELMPYALVADEAFLLRLYIMKPFTQRNLAHYQRIYNY